jgi:hypothetical protein
MAKFAAKDSNKNITLSPHGTGNVVVGTGAADANLKSDGNHNLILATGNSTTGSITIAHGADGNVELTPNNSGLVVLGSGAQTCNITSRGDHNISIKTGNSTTGSITITDGADGDIDITPNGTGEVNIPKVDIDSGAVDGITLGTNSAVTEAQIDNINVNGNAIISTNTNGDIDLTPNGSGEVNISKVDIDSGNISGTDVNVSSNTFTTSESQKDAIVSGCANDAIPIAKLASDAITIAGSSIALGSSITANTIINAVNSGQLITSGPINMVSGSIPMAVGGSATVPTFSLGAADRMYLFITHNVQGAQGGALMIGAFSSTAGDPGTQFWNNATTISFANSSGTVTLTVQNNNGGAGTYPYRYMIIRLK